MWTAFDGPLARVVPVINAYNFTWLFPDPSTFHHTMQVNVANEKNSLTAPLGQTYIFAWCLWMLIKYYLLSCCWEYNKLKLRTWECILKHSNGYKLHIAFDALIYVSLSITNLKLVTVTAVTHVALKHVYLFAHLRFSFFNSASEDEKVFVTKDVLICFDTFSCLNY